MGKHRIAVWGITDSIWECLLENLDWRSMEISFFIDNNPLISGKVYEGIRIYSFNQITTEEIAEVEYILIAAYSGYSSICMQMKEYGINSHKVQPFISLGMKRYNFGKIENLNEQLILEIYNKPNRMIEMAHRYNKNVQVLENISPLSGNQDKWYKRYSIIAHACGGWVNGQKLMYTNSKEALEGSLKSGAKVIECDIWGIERGEVIVCHDYINYGKAGKPNYTIQHLPDVLKAIIKYKDVYLLIDVKWEKIEEYDCYLNYITEVVEGFGKKEQEQLKKQIIMEVYDERSIQKALKEGFDVFFTQYRNQNRDDYQETLKICLKYNVGVVGYSFEGIDSTLLSVFRSKNISVFGFSCNSITKYAEMRKLGLDGIFSDFILED